MKNEVGGERMDRIREIKADLREIMEAEAMRVFRLARRMEAHGCSYEAVNRCREEAFLLHNGDVTKVLDPFMRWEYAFIGGGK